MAESFKKPILLKREPLPAFGTGTFKVVWNNAGGVTPHFITVYEDNTGVGQSILPDAHLGALALMGENEVDGRPERYFRPTTDEPSGTRTAKMVYDHNHCKNTPFQGRISVIGLYMHGGTINDVGLQSIVETFPNGSTYEYPITEQFKNHPELLNAQGVWIKVIDPRNPDQGYDTVMEPINLAKVEEVKEVKEVAKIEEVVATIFPGTVGYDLTRQALTLHHDLPSPPRRLSVT